jgi:two-component system, LytTR family, response regulator
VKAYLIDDEPLAVRRLRRLLEETGRVDVAGESSNPAQAVRQIRKFRPDVLFLDIEMPGMSGFELLEQLGEPQPLVVFTTAFDRYALDAFKVNSIDYLLKPVSSEQLVRALNKLERILGGAEARGDVGALLAQVRTLLAQRQPEYLVRVASRAGGRVEFIEVAQVTHFFARDKVTFAITGGKEHIVDLSITELEAKLPPERWVRIHRSTLVNIDAVKELHTWFGGKLLIKLKDGRTELHVARERASEVRARLGV